METISEGRLAALVEPLRSAPERSAVLCDVDGTLAPIVDDPHAARVPPSTRDLLATLASEYGMVGCVTGRRASEARVIVGLPKIHYAGNHGLELLAPGDAEPRLDPSLGARAGLARSFVDRLDLTVLEESGIRPEDKGPIQALHWRGAEDEELAEARAREIAERAAEDGLVPHWGRKVLEIRPVDAIDKGTAIRALLGETGPDRALFGGDDRTDVDGFEMLAALRGSGRLTVAVRVAVDSAEAPAGLVDAADAVVAGPAGFADVLRVLAGDG
jgi:trehalose-phosphatase